VAAILNRLAYYDTAAEITDDIDAAAAQNAIDAADAYLTENADTITAKDQQAIKDAIADVAQAIIDYNNGSALATAKEKALATLAANVANDSGDEAFTNDWSNWNPGMVDAAELYISAQSDPANLTPSSVAQNGVVPVETAQNT